MHKVTFEVIVDYDHEEAVNFVSAIGSSFASHGSVVDLVVDLECDVDGEESILD